MKIIHVVVKAGSKKGPSVQLGPDGTLLIYVKELALDGKANKAVIEQLSQYFQTPKSTISLKSGATNKHKAFIID